MVKCFIGICARRINCARRDAWIDEQGRNAHAIAIIGEIINFLSKGRNRKRRRDMIIYSPIFIIDDDKQCLFKDLRIFSKNTINLP